MKSVMRLLPVLAAFVVLAPLTAAAPAPVKHLAVEKVVIFAHGGARNFKMEIAADPASRELGLMHRTHLAKDAGMLFDFGQPVMTAFWMKDTPLPLDIIFVRADGVISTIAANAVPFSEAQIVAAEPVRAVLEIGGGLARKLGIAPGDRVSASIFPKAH